ncbi:LysE family translocator [Piscinibacter sp. XHJ-5]|uniref:LysE family translocator n=1 Tax=Piscinibacter sp. XHJ-5 TaxID=3037797 RepID=UPI002452DD2A|nr:LysE family translocator [Piscinibacter sp. XHJ-5]
MTWWQVFDATTIATYMLAGVALVIAPGPGQALVIARSLQGGVRAGVLTAAGLEIGTLVHVVAAALGLSMILAHSATAFAVVKYLGAAYLIWLGVKALREAKAQAGPASDAGSAAAASGRRLLMHAAVTGVLNPKVALFFLAFLPQFVHPERGAVLLQFVVLGGLLALTGLMFDSLVAWLTGRARRRLASNPRFAAWRERVMGGVLIGLGLRLALVEHKR